VDTCKVLRKCPGCFIVYIYLVVEPMHYCQIIFPSSFCLFEMKWEMQIVHLARLLTPKYEWCNAPPKWMNLYTNVSGRSTQRRSLSSSSFHFKLNPFQSSRIMHVYMPNACTCVIATFWFSNSNSYCIYVAPPVHKLVVSQSHQICLNMAAKLSNWVSQKVIGTHLTFHAL